MAQFTGNLYQLTQYQDNAVKVRSSATFYDGVTSKITTITTGQIFPPRSK